VRNRHRPGAHRMNLPARRCFGDAVADHLAREPSGRLAGVRSEFVQLRGKRVGQCDLQATAHRLYPQECSLTVFVLVLLVVVMRVIDPEHAKPATELVPLKGLARPSCIWSVLSWSEATAFRLSTVARGRRVLAVRVAKGSVSHLGSVLGNRGGAPRIGLQGVSWQLVGRSRPFGVTNTHEPPQTNTIPLQLADAQRLPS